jgi:hypothetical protein
MEACNIKPGALVTIKNHFCIYDKLYNGSLLLIHENETKKIKDVQFMFINEFKLYGCDINKTYVCLLYNGKYFFVPRWNVIYEE